MRNTSTWRPSAPSPTLWPREGWNWLLTAVVLLGIVAVFFLAQFAYIIVAATTGLLTTNALRTGTLPPDQMLLVQFVSWAPIAVFVLLVLPALSRASWSELGFRKPTWREVGVGLAGALLMTLVVNGVATIIASVTHRHDTEQAVALLNQMKTPAQRAEFVLLACVFAPFCEELTFRAFLFNGITRYANVPIAAIVSGIAFGLLHATNRGELITVAPPLALGGIILAYVYAYTKCFWANTITHATFNTISVLGFFVAGIK